MEEGSQITPVQKGSKITPVQKGSKITPTEKGSQITPVQKGSQITPVQKGSQITPTEKGSQITPVQKGSKITPTEKGSRYIEDNYAFPDPITFINTSYKEFSLADLQDALIAFSKSISETKKKLSHLGPKNFSKLIGCKGTMEGIYESYVANQLSAKSSDKLVEKMIEDFRKLLENYDIDLKEKKKQENVRDDLLRLKESLKSSMLNFTKFIDTLEEVEWIPEMQESIVPIVKEFLVVVYEKIMETSTGFEEACKLVDFYMKASSWYESTVADEMSVDKKKVAINNTLLVSFKEASSNRKRDDDDYYSYLFRTLAQILLYLEDEQGKEVIRHGFKCFFEVLSETNPRHSIVVFRRIEDFKRTLQTTGENRHEIKEQFSKLKTDLFEVFVEKSSLKESIAVFNMFLGVFSEAETRRSQAILLHKTKKQLLESKLHGFEYLQQEDEEIKKITPCLGTKDSRNVRELNRNLRERRKKELEGIINGFRLMLEEKTGDVEVLMQAARIVDEAAEQGSFILGECRDLIKKRRVVWYFLSESLKTEKPILGEDEWKVVEKLKFQFEFY
ncbi:hypothetical protein GINT2_000293 [Glugoides intestinalis]